MTKQTPIGLSLPLKNAGVGFFEQTFDAFAATRINIISLLRTKPGERRMQPLFGCRLYNIVFEQNTEMLSERMQTIIKEDIDNWIAGVSVNKVNINFFKNEENDMIDIYKIYIAVSYTVNIINQSDVVDLIISTTRI